MSGDELLSILEKNKWKLTPIMEKDKNSREVVLAFWIVSDRVLGGNGWQNVSTWSEAGPTIEEAILKAVKLHGKKEKRKKRSE